MSRHPPLLLLSVLGLVLAWIAAVHAGGGADSRRDAPPVGGPVGATPSIPAEFDSVLPVAADRIPLESAPIPDVPTPLETAPASRAQTLSADGVIEGVVRLPEGVEHGAITLFLYVDGSVGAAPSRRAVVEPGERYRFEGLLAGFHYVLAVEPRDLAPGLLPIHPTGACSRPHPHSGIEIACKSPSGGGQSTVLDVEIHRAASVMGRVLDASGTPIPGTTISVKYADGLHQRGLQPPLPFEAGPEGRFRLDTLYPCEAELWFESRDEGRFMPRRRFRVPLRLSPNRVQDLGEVTLRPGFHAICGRVVDQEGRALARVLVSCVPRGGDAFDSLLEAWTDEDGAFCLEGLPAEPVDVRLHLANTPIRPLFVESPFRPVPVDLDRSAAQVQLGELTVARKPSFRVTGRIAWPAAGIAAESRRRRLAVEVLAFEGAWRRIRMLHVDLESGRFRFATDDMDRTLLFRFVDTAAPDRAVLDSVEVRPGPDERVEVLLSAE